MALHRSSATSSGSAPTAPTAPTGLSVTAGVNGLTFAWNAATDTQTAASALNYQLRKIIKNRGHFPNDEAASKLIFLALRNITADWSRAAKEWKLAMNQFAILYEERFTQAAHGAGR